MQISITRALSLIKSKQQQLATAIASKPSDVNALIGGQKAGVNSAMLASELQTNKVRVTSLANSVLTLKKKVNESNNRTFVTIGGRSMLRMDLLKAGESDLVILPNGRQPRKTLFEEFHKLSSIWSGGLSLTAAEATKKWENNHLETGWVYTFHFGSSVVGISGWHQQSPTEAGLRWHGVVPEFRNKGFSRIMLDTVICLLPRDVKAIYEVTRNPESKDSFCKCGFTVVTDKDTVRRAEEAAEYPTCGGWVLVRDVKR